MVIILKVRRLLYIGLLLFYSFQSFTQHLSGFIKDFDSNEILSNVTIKTLYGKVFALSNENGYFSIQNYNGEPIHFTMVGYSKLDTCCFIKSSKISIFLKTNVQLLKEVEITGNNDNNFFNNSIKLTASEISAYPSLFGEKDLIKVVQTLPGVKRIVEGGAGFSVRGGGPDQNLILVDNVPMYSYNHLFGLFSMFNTDVVNDVELSKEAISAKYGGRASSVLNIKMKEGNSLEWKPKLTIGLISSKIKLEGPIIKNKVNGMISFRRSYFDILTKPFLPKDQQQYYFLRDFFGKITYNLNARSKLLFGHYSSVDKYLEIFRKSDDSENYLENKESFGWRNNVNYLKYNYTNKNIFFSANLHQTKYDFFYNSERNSKINSKNIPLFLLNYNSKIQDEGLDFDIEKYFSNVSFFLGIGTLKRNVKPQTVINTFLDDKKSLIYKADLKENWESHFYFETKSTIVKNLIISTGFRAVNWNSISRKYYLEPRLSTIWDLKQFGLKLSYFKINQFVHQLSNSGGTLPNDIWITANNYALPINANQVSFSGMKTIHLPKSEFYFELGVYSKKMKNIIDYNNGQNILSMTEVLANDKNNLSDVISTGKGFSYGLELLTKFKNNKINATLSYTFANTFYLFDKINFGDKYFPNFDRRHDLSINLNYKFSNKIAFSFSNIFGTASPITLPLGILPISKLGNETKQFSGISSELLFVNYRNNYRIEPYFRTDIGGSIKKSKRKTERIWEISVFNSTVRKNPLYYYVLSSYEPKSEQKIWKAQKQTFLTIVPSLSYTINF